MRWEFWARTKIGGASTGRCWFTPEAIPGGCRSTPRRQTVWRSAFARAAAGDDDRVRRNADALGGVGRGNSQRAAGSFGRCGVAVRREACGLGPAGRDRRRDAPGCGNRKPSRCLRGWRGRQVYTFLQKPTLAEVKAAGGVLEDGRVAVDIGLLRFDADLTAALTELCGIQDLPAVDLYDQITRGLTGQWKPEKDAGRSGGNWRESLRAPERLPAFHCAVVEGEFIHAGTTRSFRTLAAGSGGILDSVIGEGSQGGPRSRDPGMRPGRASVRQPRRNPAWTHRIERGRGSSRRHRGSPVAGRVAERPRLGDPRVWSRRRSEADVREATWFNRPILETLERLGLRGRRGVEAGRKLSQNQRCGTPRCFQ